MAHQAVDVEQRKAGRPVAHHHDHLAIGAGDARRHGVAHAGAKAAVRAWVEPAPGLVRVDVLAGVRNEIAAVAHHHGVTIEQLAQLAIDARRLDGIAVCAQQRCVVGRERTFGIAQVGDPRFVVVTGTAIVGEPAQNQRQIAGH